jgi:mannosyltransferase
MVNASRPPSPRARGSSGRLSLLAGVLIIVVAAGLRFDRLGERSLWLDEFSTWHVSRMGLADSLRWGPERTVAPLYQLCLRVLTGQAHPPEWLLRLPAAVAGTLVVGAAWCLGCRLGGSAVGVALALMLACNPLQIHYSQEARPYSLLVLGATLSVLLWQQLLNRPTRRSVAACALVMSLAVYAHHLVVLVLFGQVGWWVQRELRRPNRRRFSYVLMSLAATALLCLPLLVRTLSGLSDVSGALAWIEPPTVKRAVAMLAEVTFGYAWLAALLPAVLLWGACRAGWNWQRRPPIDRAADQAEENDHKDAGWDASDLLIWWLGSSWLGLFLVSRFVTPLMVTRYVLPAAVPALLIPLLVARRLHRHGPLLLAALAVALSLPTLRAGRALPPLGFRELISFLQERVDPRTAAVVHAIESVQPECVELERLAFRYYPLTAIPVCDWLVNRPVADDKGPILADPRRL